MRKLRVLSAPANIVSRTRQLLVLSIVIALSSVPIMTGAGTATAAESQSPPQLVVSLTATDVAGINQEIARSGGLSLPATTQALVVQGSAVAPATAGGDVLAAPSARSGGWGTAWKIVKCTASIGTFIAGNLLLVTKVRKLGGVVKVAKKLVAAKNKEARLNAAIAFFGDVSGVGAVVSQCS